MRKTLIAGAALMVGLLAGCAQPGYGPGYGYGSSSGYGPSYGYGPSPYGYYAQPAPNPMTQMLGAMLAPSGGYNQPYYQPTPSYGPYGWR